MKMSFCKININSGVRRCNDTLDQKKPHSDRLRKDRYVTKYLDNFCMTNVVVLFIQLMIFSSRHHWTVTPTSPQGKCWLMLQFGNSISCNQASPIPMQ